MHLCFTDMSHIYVFKLYLAVCNIHATYIYVKYICLIEKIYIYYTRHNLNRLHIFIVKYIYFKYKINNYKY